jgi:bifunctional ADP-heptose synthase (sugar kinase/adenylyltransferase)
VNLLTNLGAKDSQEDFVRQSLNPRIRPHFLYLKDAPTIMKRRFVETYPLQKLFEVYFMNGDQVEPSHVRAMCERLEDLIGDCDLVVVNDYGHGMLGPEMVDLLCSGTKFLAVNTQVNAANHGFNTVSKYRRADYIAVSEGELRLDARSRSRRLRDIVVETSRRLSCDRMIITQGSRGSLAYSSAEGFFEVPAFTSRIVDRVGAGDSVFAVTALCLAQQAPMELAGVIGNAVGAEAVMTVGNRKPIDKVSLCKHITSLLK